MIRNTQIKFHEMVNNSSINKLYKYTHKNVLLNIYFSFEYFISYMLVSSIKNEFT